MKGSPARLRLPVPTRFASGIVFAVSIAATASVLLPSAWASPSPEPPSPDTRGSSDSSRERDAQSERVYRLGLAAADVDTSLDDFVTSAGAITEQCGALNEMVRAVCCREFEVGCDVRYECDLLSVDGRDRMTEEPYLYVHELGKAAYAMHHGSVQKGLARQLRTLQLYGRLEQKLPVAYTRHPILIDDEETKIASNKIDRSSPAFLLLGRVLPGVSARRGTRMHLDYFASRDGLLLSLAPANRTSLAQAIAEYRAGLFSFHRKQFTGHGARDLFDLKEGVVVPRLSGCQALAIKEPAHFRAFLPPVSE